MSAAAQGADKTDVRFGVFVIHDVEATRAMYQPQIDYFNDQLESERTELVVVPHDKMMDLIAERELDYGDYQHLSFSGCA